MQIKRSRVDREMLANDKEYEAHGYPFVFVDHPVGELGATVAEGRAIRFKTD